MQNWSCMHLYGHSSVKFLWSCDARAQDSFPLFLNQPNVSKICSFINLCIHPSPFRASGEIFTAFTLQVYTHFFFKKLVMISEFFKEKLQVISFQKHVGFSARQLIFLFSLFFLCLFLFLICFLFFSPFFFS